MSTAERLRDLQAPARASLRSAGQSHPGLVRDRNEDRLHVDGARGIFIVVDGMGGEAGGETAAETALKFLRQRLERQTGTIEERIREAIAVANNEIFRLSRANPAWQGMGCVLTVAVVQDGTLTVGHVGDSRLYRLRAGRIEKLTHDHSPVGEREDQGELSERDAMSHPRRNEVYRSVGTEEHTPLDPDFVEILELDFEEDSALLLCSDGLSDFVAAGEMLRIVQNHAADERAVVRNLIDAANAAGGRDNVTVLFAAGRRFGRLPAAAAQPPVASPSESSVRLSPPGGRSAWFALGALCGLLLFAALSFLDLGLTQKSDLAPPSSPLVAPPRTLRVGTGAEFSSIGEALTAARPGDTVLLAPGTYREQARLEEGVTLASEVPRQAVLAPLAEGGASPTVALVAEGIAGGRVVGLTIAGSASAPLDIGIVLRDAAVTVEDTEVSGARLAGVEIAGSATPTIRASFIHDNAGTGIAVHAPAAPRLAHNLILGNGRGTQSAAAGIELAPGSSAELTGNLIAGNAAEGIRGVPLASREEVLARNYFELKGKTNRRGAVSIQGAPAR